jgi:hypothetical protein
MDPKTSIDAALYEPQLRTIEHLAHHAISLLRRAQATLETIQSLARERMLPWGVDGAVRELDPEEVEAVRAMCEDLIEEIREARHEAEAADNGKPESDATGDEEATKSVGPHFDEERPVPCAS